MRLLVFISLLHLIHTKLCDWQVQDSLDDDNQLKNVEGVVYNHMYGGGCFGVPMRISSTNSDQIFSLKFDEHMLSDNVFRMVNELAVSLHMIDSAWTKLDLSWLQTIESGKSLIITDNFNLKRFILNPGFSCENCEIIVRGNPQLVEEDLNRLKAILKRNRNMKFDVQSSGECSGKHILQLADLENCEFVFGDLILEGNKFYGSLPKHYQLKSVDGCLIVDHTSITDSRFLFATQVSCSRRRRNTPNALTYSYIGENELMCGSHNALVEDSLRRVNRRERISWQNNCDQEQEVKSDMGEKEQPEILKWDVRVEEESDELAFVLCVIFLLVTTIVFSCPFLLSRMRVNYTRKTTPYGPYGPLSELEREVDRPFYGYMDYIGACKDRDEEGYAVSIRKEMTREQEEGQRQE